MSALSVESAPPAPSRDEIVAARRAWNGLAWNVRRRVLRRAKRGEFDLDQRVAKIGYRWATTYVAVHETRARRAGRYGGALVVDGVSMISSALLFHEPGLGGSSELVDLWVRRRLAGRILRLGPPPGS